jgi:hypothetical protein
VTVINLMMQPNRAGLCEQHRKKKHQNYFLFDEKQIEMHITGQQIRQRKKRALSWAVSSRNV